MKVTAIRVLMVDKESHDAIDLWEIEGQVQLDEGDVITFGEELPGTDTTIAPVEPTTAGHYIDIHLLSQDSRGNERDYFGHFDGDRLSPDQWLRNGGGFGTDPC